MIVKTDLMKVTSETSSSHHTKFNLCIHFTICWLSENFFQQRTILSNPELKDRSVFLRLLHVDVNGINIKLQIYLQ